jgi:hypothetical protein
MVALDSDIPPYWPFASVWPQEGPCRRGNDRDGLQHDIDFEDDSKDKWAAHARRCPQFKRSSCRLLMFLGHG